jgi:hypothetical protein
MERKRLLENAKYMTATVSRLCGSEGEENEACGWRRFKQGVCCCRKAQLWVRSCACLEGVCTLASLNLLPLSEFPGLSGRWIGRKDKFWRSKRRTKRKVLSAPYLANQSEMSKSQTVQIWKYSIQCVVSCDTVRRRLFRDHSMYLINNEMSSWNYQS